MDKPHLHGFFLSLANPDPSPPFFSGGVDDRLPHENTSSSTQPQKGRNKGVKVAPVRLHGRLVDPVLGVPKPKFKRKPPDPSSADTTAPCSECGKRFWSQKALFGHMRCHPERQWRGITPPPHLRRPLQYCSSGTTPRPPVPLQRRHPVTFGAQQIFHDAELEAAACLLMLANGPTPAGAQGTMAGMDGRMGSAIEWSECTTFFGSQQAPGSGQSAARKNITASFAAVRNKGEDELRGTIISFCNNSSSAASGGIDSGLRAAEGMVMMVSGDGRHGASSSSGGQALEERMRRHWDREKSITSCPSGRRYVPDLNLPPPIDGFEYSSA